MIVTGQQPAVGGGPLYTLVKTAHALVLARRRGEPALFWCASEDHDLGEAGHADLVLRDGTIRRFAGDLGGGRHSLRFRPANAWWDGLTAFAQQHLGPGPGAEFLRRQAPRGDEGLGAWLCRLMQALFPGLEVAEAHTLRPRWRAQVERAIAAWPAVELAALRRDLLAEGAADAFGELDQPPLFRDAPDGRTALTPDEARALLAAGGEGELSPGAALRPILQQAALPCTAYVGGPGELAYHRFIMPLYPALGVAAPELVPRCSLTLLPTWCARSLDRLGVEPDGLAGYVPPPPTAADSAPLVALDGALAELAALGDPALAGSARRLARERAHLARRLERRARARQDHPAPGPLRAYLAPRGLRQERTMSLFQALWEHGPGLAQALLVAAADSVPGGHRYVRL